MKHLLRLSLNRATLFAVLTGVVFLTADAQEVRQAVAVNPTANRALSVGDVVSYRVEEDRDPPIQLVVTDSGELEVPYLGRIRVNGRTPSQAASAIKAALEKDYYYKATVQLSVDQMVRTTVAAGQVYLSGQVRTPGPQDIRSGERETAGKVLLRAGGLAEFADSRKVKIVRKATGNQPPETVIVDLKEVLEQGRIEKDVEVFDGDLIIVPQRLFNW